MESSCSKYSYAYGNSDHGLKYLRATDVLDRITLSNPTKTAFISEYENITKTYSELSNDVNKLVQQLFNLGLKRGDVVGMWCGNAYSWIPLFYACGKLGIILCAIHPTYKSQELDHVLRTAQIKALFMPGPKSDHYAINDFYSVLMDTLNTDSNHPDELLLKHIIITDGAKFEICSKISNINVELLFNQNGKNSNIPQSVFDIVEPEDPFIIMFTSGTTGKSKGACLSQFTMVNNALIIGRTYGNYNKVLCCPAPFYHVLGMDGIMGICAHPTTLVVPSCRYSTSNMVASMIKHKCTDMWAIPTMLSDMLSNVQSKQINLVHLRSIMLAGALVTPELAARLKAILPKCTDARVCYGATEICGGFTISNFNDTNEHRLGTIGRPVENLEARIVDSNTGNIVKVGVAGEIQARGHSRMIGYWREPEMTKAAFDERNWYKTGDMGTMDEHGYIKIAGRIKDMIIVGGENVYPQELENLLREHHDVLDAYVVGVPDKRKGEAICAWIQLKHHDVNNNLADKCDKTTENEIKEYCKHKMAPYKVPRYILFVNSFPLSPVGKVQKYLIRQQSAIIFGDEIYGQKNYPNVNN